MCKEYILTWTFAPFGGAVWSTPPSVALPFNENGCNDTVYFAESYPWQMRADGVALGGVVFQGNNSRMEGTWNSSIPTATVSATGGENSVGSLVQ